MSSFLGVDAGGTKTAVLLADGERVIGSASGPPGAVRPGRGLQAASRIAAVVRRALTDAVQKVQVSAYPYAYAKWEKMAADLVLASYGAGPYAPVAAH